MSRAALRSFRRLVFHCCALPSGVFAGAFSASAAAAAAAGGAELAGDDADEARPRPPLPLPLPLPPPRPWLLCLSRASGLRSPPPLSSACCFPAVDGDKPPSDGLSPTGSEVAPSAIASWGDDGAAGIPSFDGIPWSIFCASVLESSRFASPTTSDPDVTRCDRHLQQKCMYVCK